MPRLLLPALLVLALAGCDSQGLSLPPPGAYPERSLAEVYFAEPGRYNTRGVVIGAVTCPRDAVCELPAHVILGQHAGDDPPQVGIRVLADPAAFEIGAAYLVSIEAQGQPHANRFFGLLGAAELAALD